MTGGWWARVRRWWRVFLRGQRALDAEAIAAGRPVVRPAPPDVVVCPHLAAWAGELRRAGLLAAGYRGPEPPPVGTRLPAGFAGIVAMTVAAEQLPAPWPPPPLVRKTGDRDPHFEPFDVVTCTACPDPAWIYVPLPNERAGRMGGAGPGGA